MGKNINCFLTAIRFLTILPISWHADKDGELYRESVKYFAIVGIFIGFTGLIFAKCITLFVPQIIACCFLLLFLSLISGFLHLDGFADSMDGLFSHRSREKVLDIMHDSRTGAMGVICIFFLLIFKFASLSTVPLQYLPALLFFMPAAGRCAIVITMYMLPYARKEDGLGKLFYPERKVIVPLTALFLFLGSGMLINSRMTFIAVAVVLFTSFFFGIWCKRIIGGTTGDTLGAVCELTEANVSIFLAVYLNL